MGVSMPTPQPLDPVQYYQQQRELMLRQHREDRSSLDQRSFRDYSESLNNQQQKELIYHNGSVGDQSQLPEYINTFRSKQDFEIGADVQKFSGDGHDNESYRADGVNYVQPLSLQENNMESYHDIYTQRNRIQSQQNGHNLGNNYDQSGYESDDEAKHRMLYGHGQTPVSYRSSHLNAVHSDEYDLTPKHKIQTPIMEETESTVEQELRSRGQSRRLRRYDSNNEISNHAEELKLTLSGHQEAPEPQYTETKSSILRRRNSKAKLNSNGKFNDGPMSERQFKRKRKFNSLSDLTSVKKNAHQSNRRR